MLLDLGLTLCQITMIRLFLFRDLVVNSSSLKVESCFHAVEVFRRNSQKRKHSQLHFSYGLAFTGLANTTISFHGHHSAFGLANSDEKSHRLTANH